MSERYVHAIWCDDIRQEVGNKPSFMGVYTGGILLPELPVVLPRLSVYIWTVTPIDTPFEKLTIRIVRDDGFLLVEFQPIPSDSFMDSAQVSRPDATTRVGMAAVNLGGVELPVGCRYLNIVVETESGTIEGPRLNIDIGDASSLVPIVTQPT